MDEQKEVWWVMTHLNPGLIEKFLQMDNQGYFLKEGEPSLPMVEFFIPFQFIKHQKLEHATELESKMENGIREALHSYVFIKADKDRIRRIVESEWNTSGRLHLYHVRDNSGKNLSVSDAEIQPFFETIKTRQLKFYIGQPVKGMSVGDSVILQMEPWKGRKGTITGIAFHENRISMSVSVELFGNFTSINFTDVRDGDVVFEDPEKEILFTGNLLENFETEMISILGGGDNLKRLNRLYAYRDIQVEGEDGHRQFTALMLICSHLLKQQDDRYAYLSQIESWLGSNRTPTTATEAYMVLALFVVTHNPRLREALKEYRSTHPDCPEALSKMISKVKRIRVRKSDR